MTDAKSLRRLAVQLGETAIPGLGVFPLLAVRQRWRPANDVDADLIRAGLRCYVRDELLGEWPEGFGEHGTHVLVEAAGGVVKRRPMRLVRKEATGVLPEDRDV